MSLNILISVTILLLIAIINDGTCEDNLNFGQSCSSSNWKLFKENYSKSYGTNMDEDRSRMAIFCRNLNRILRHNANSSSTFQLALNHLSDKTPEELSKMMPRMNRNRLLGKKFLTDTKLLKIVRDINAEPPAELDYSKDLQRVSPARNQGDCGCCWAFSIVAMLEGQQRPLGEPRLVPLSEQNMVDCDRKNEGCSGGLYPDALAEIKRYGGLMRRVDYPYVSDRTGKQGLCKMDPDRAFETTVNLGETLWIPPNNETLLKQFVANYGPVAVCIYAAYFEFIGYKSGIYYDDEWVPDELPNHGVVIVGYGTDSKTGRDYWKVKNSWSSDWGEQGFGYMSRNRNNNIGIASMAYISMPSSQV